MKKISQLELGLLLCLFNYSTMVGFWIGPLAGIASYSGWAVLPIAAIIGSSAAGVTVWLGNRLDDRMPGHSGGMLQTFLALLLTVPAFGFFLHQAAYIMKEFTDFMAQMYLPTTPEWLLTALFLYTAAIAVRSGLETIVRCASGFFFVVFMASLLAPLLVTKDVNFDRSIALVTHFRFDSMWEAVYKTAPWFGESFFVLFLLPRIDAPQRTYRTLLIASIGSSLVTAFYYIYSMLLFGQSVTAHLTYPVMEVIRYVRIGDFLENMDPLMEAIWTASIFIKLCTLLYIVTLLMTRIVKVKDGRPFSFVTAAIVFGIVNQMNVSTTELNDFFQSSWATFAWFIVLSTILVLALYLSFAKMNAAAYQTPSEEGG
ncbi:GerAB/ArcD/ProY family transporter [Paenibacillus aurantiacus]|uniref:GerAB/ArcD/ProY family transporter n=1 Tax=Paenibacillus aurantiacus TaxID=1936118 RepID=A0ABV5KV45_9BACL